MHPNTRKQKKHLTFFAVFPSEACVRAVAVDLAELDAAVSSVEAGVLLDAQILQIVMDAVAVEKSGRHLAHLQIGDQAHEGRLVFDRADVSADRRTSGGMPPTNRSLTTAISFRLERTSATLVSPSTISMVSR